MVRIYTQWVHMGGGGGGGGIEAFCGGASIIF